MVTETYKKSEISGNEYPVVINNLSFAYGGADESKLNVLTEINIDLKPGEIVGLVGRNGSGKTTLLELIRGRLVPQKGNIFISGRLVSEDGRLKNIPRISVISQNPDACLAPSMTVYENYILANTRNVYSLSWPYSKKLRDRCRSMLKRANMELEKKLNEQSRFLSGGQQQALSILLALEVKSPVLLLDEPTAALDPFSASKVIDLAEAEIHRTNGSMLLISHRIRDIIERCDRVLLLRSGFIKGDINLKISELTEHDLLKLMSVGDDSASSIRQS